MWKVFWYESGTGYSRVAGPFKTIEEARSAPRTKLYPPVYNSIQIYKVEEEK